MENGFRFIAVDQPRHHHHHHRHHNHHIAIDRPHRSQEWESSDADRAVGMVGTDIYDKVETLTYCQPINEPTRAALDLSSADCFH